MSIIATRIGTTLGFPADYESVAMSSAQCEELLKSFSSDRAAGKWTLTDERDARDMPPDVVREWLKQSPNCGAGSLVWVGIGEGVTIEFKDFVQFYDDLWFPSSDDLVIVLKDGQLAFTLSHEEVLSRYKASKSEEVRANGIASHS